MTEALATTPEKTAGERAWGELGRLLHRRLILIYLTASLAATGTGALFFLFGLDFSAYQKQLVLGLLAPLASLPQMIADILVIGRHVAPIRAFFAALPGPSATSLAAPALARALNLPLYTAARVLFLHAPVLAMGLTVACLLANARLGLGLAPWQFALVYATVVVFASGHAIYEYLAVKSAVKPVLPHIRAHVDEAVRDAVPKVLPLKMRSQLLFVFAFVACVPLAALGYTVLLKLDRLLAKAQMFDFGWIEDPLEVWVLLLVIGGSSLALFLATMLSRDIASSAGDLVEAMRRVERGEVSAELVVASTDEFAEAYRGFNRMTHGLVERERLRDAFGRYVAPELAEQVMKHGVSMGGSLVRATVIFADIRGFTSLSEAMSPVEVVSLLNRYFAAVSPPIRAEGGFINKFGGDSLLAVFGAPVPASDHAERAARAALGVRAALARFNEREVAEGRAAVRIGIGLHTGEMVAGSVGSPDRMEYTVIGDVVNVAARIEGLTKELGTDILLSEAAHERVKDIVTARPMPPVTVRGKAEPIVVYAVVDPA
ncbi:adenylate/guanylate cyclase domain-containing protein [Polyangium mundeleinium]|uniref:Adenylate/guanylate cyclase domain-containing protein n=1 Tax=Polyangium mundeleinium TaxID=2995306 RepID=A0ABT5EWP6_9BACT|nr:adenylate/guanylate cyclase domain-containing protein [Polyangium mundeleinium]MDC0746225.1 adenylate/guanylate cyclase domain-containing protein [Polyangium mundeleinium]